MPDNTWARLLAYVTGLVNQKLLLQNEYLAAENRILRAHLPARMPLSDPQRSSLAEIGRRLGRTALQEVACVAKPDTILAWPGGEACAFYGAAFGELLRALTGFEGTMRHEACRGRGDPACVWRAQRAETYE